MAISSIGATSALAPTQGTIAPTSPKAESFAKVLEQSALTVAPQQASPCPTVATAQSTAGKSPALETAAQALDRVSQAQQRMEQVLKLAESGKAFSPAELLALQANVYRASQELDLAGKVVEKATGGIKQVLQTQV